MDTRTGEIHELTEEQQRMLGDCLVPIARDLTAQERFNKQIMLYQPCGCGSGKKFKFCCHSLDKKD